MRTLKLVALVLVPVTSLLADGKATLKLSSSRDGAEVAPGTPIPWSIRVTDSADDNLGLALVSVDLEQAPANPALFDLPPGDGVPQAFVPLSAPRGVSNPPRGGAVIGFAGLPSGHAGRRNLAQIGGALNTFGRAGSRMGTSPQVSMGLGQGGALLLAQGSFPAPSQPGSYRFSLENGAAATLREVRALPGFSPVSRAMVMYSRREITFTVISHEEQAAFVRGDVNSDGAVDLTDVVRVLGRLYLGDPELQCRKSTDVDGNGALEITDAINLLNFLYLGGSAPPHPHPACGSERTPTPLSCESFPGCH